MSPIGRQTAIDVSNDFRSTFVDSINVYNYGLSGVFIDKLKKYNPFLVYCRELAPSTVSLTGDRAQGDDSKHDSHYSQDNLKQGLRVIYMFHVSVEKIILFHDATMDISAYN